MLVSLWVLRVNKVGRCERFVSNTLFLSWVVSLWQRSFQKYQQKNHYQKFPQKNLVCMSCLVHLRTVRFFNPFFVVPKKYPYLSSGRFSWFELQLCIKLCFKLDLPSLWNFQLPFLGQEWIFSGTTHCCEICCRKGCWPSLNVCLLFFFFQQLRKDHRRKRKMKEKQKWSQHYRHSWSVSIMMIKLIHITMAGPPSIL